MAVALLLRRDPAGTGAALGLIAAAGFLLAPAAPPLFLALALLVVGGRPVPTMWQGVAVGALTGLAAVKGLVESAGSTVAVTPWAAAVAAGTVPLALAWTRRAPDADFI